MLPNEFISHISNINIESRLKPGRDLKLNIQGVATGESRHYDEGSWAGIGSDDRTWTQ